ncbi:uncharacterized protein VP01_6376g1, partial [Puccinia sorghi]
MMSIAPNTKHRWDIVLAPDKAPRKFLQNSILQTFTTPNFHTGKISFMAAEDPQTDNQVWHLVTVRSGGHLSILSWRQWLILQYGILSEFQSTIVYYELSGTFMHSGFQDRSVTTLLVYAIHHMDAKNTFLNGVLDTEIYLWDLAGMPVPAGHCLKMKKAIYGL